MQKIISLQPKLIWKYFDNVLKIPRASKKEAMIRAYVEDIADKYKLRFKKDNTGNIMAYKPASQGMERRKTVILQCHLDMVCEKDIDSRHNFKSDPIDAYIEKGWIKAHGTTLGADNGIGIAAQLAVMSDKSMIHGPLECLFTVEEETGLKGAHYLGQDLISGKILINLDSEDEGELFIGCAGGMDTIIRIGIKTRLITGKHIAYKILISGLKGGHSGDDIHKGLGNSNKLISRILWSVPDDFKMRLVYIEGGNLRNAIPREALADVVIKSKFKKEFLAIIKGIISDIKDEYKTKEPNLKIEISEIPVPERSFSVKSQKRLVNSIYSCPNGVIEMSNDIPGLVETSTNLASVRLIKNSVVEVVTSQRSSYESAKVDIAQRIEALFGLSNASVKHSMSYPGWTPNINSEIVKITGTCYEKLFNKQPKIRAIHAGLECGLFLEKYPELDMISFGPTILGAHSPHERLHIESVEKFWKLLTEVLAGIPSGN